MKDPIDINLDGNGEEPPDDKGEEIVIRKEDLEDMHSPVHQVPPVAYAPIRKSIPAMVLRGPIGRNLLAGTVSAFLAGALMQFVFRSETLLAIPAGFAASALVTALYMAAASGAIGAAISAAESAAQGNMQRAASRAIVGLAFGIAGGIIGGFLAQTVAAIVISRVGEMSTERNAAMLVQLVGAFVGWLVAGTGIGIGRGFGMGPDRQRNGLISGLIGGALGGLVAGLAAISFDSAGAARVFGLMAFGASMGGAAAGTDESRTDIRLLAIGGPLQGADFMLYSGRFTMGSSPRCDIVLPGVLVAPVQCELEVEYGDIMLKDLSRSNPVLVNGEPCRTRVLIPGDVLLVGDNLLRYIEKL